MGGCHPAVIERRIVFRHVDQLARSAIRIKYFDLAGIGAHPRKRPVVNLVRFQVHPELDQIAFAQLDLPHLSDIDEVRSSLRKNPLAVSQYQLLAVYGFNARYLTGFADAFHVADEADGHARLEVRSVLQPCFRLVPRSEYLRFASCTSKHLRFLQLAAHRSRQLIALLVRRRNQNRTVQIPPLFRVLHVLPGGFLQVFLLALVDEVLFVEPFERLFMLPHRALEDAAPVFRILLAVDVGQRKLLNLRVVLQQPEKVARFDGGMLPRVAHEQHPVVVLPRQLQDLYAFAQRIQTRFIDDHVCPRRRLLLRQQESRHRLRLFEALLFQHVRCRIRRCDEADICDASRTQSLAELLQGRSLARTRHAAEQVEPVFGVQQAVNQHRLRLP